MPSLSGVPRAQANPSLRDDPRAIREQLAVICASNTFANSPRLRQFLSFVVEAYLGGQSAQLKETIIGAEVYGREYGYNPKAEPIVRSEARRLRAKLGEYYSGEGAHDSILITLPTGGYKPHVEQREIPEPPDQPIQAPAGLACPVLDQFPEPGPASHQKHWAARAVSFLPFPSRWIAVVLLLGLALLGRRFRDAFTVEKKLVWHQVTNQSSEDRVTSACVSPDGKLLAYSTVDGVFIQVLRTRDTHLLRSPEHFWVERIRWSADGDKLAVGGISRDTLQPAVWTVSVIGSMPKLLLRGARDPELSPDGAHVAYTSADRSEIWTSDLEGGQPRRVVNLRPEKGRLFFWSHDGSHVTFARVPSISEPDPTWEVHGSQIVPSTAREAMSVFQSVDVRTGLLTARFQLDTDRAVLTDSNRVLLFVGGSEHALADQSLWAFTADPQTGTPIDSPKQIHIPSAWMRDLSVAANGQLASVVEMTTASTVYVADFSTSPPALTNVRRFTLDGSENFPHSWTADSKSILFESDRRGSRDLFRQDLGSRVAENIFSSPLEDFQPNLTPDARWVLFMQIQPSSVQPATLLRLPVSGGTVVPLVESGKVDEFRCAQPGGLRCVARKTVGHEAYIFYDLDPIRGLGRELARTDFSPNYYGDWALSPDGREVAIPIHDAKTAKIKLLELDRHIESEITVAATANIAGLNWTADGRGWFAAINTAFGRRLSYVDRSGSATPLLDGAGYAIASPDGRKVAMNIPSVSANVWTVADF